MGGVLYGLPGFAHPDETILVPLAVQLLTGELNPHFFNWPSLSAMVLAALAGLRGALREAAGGPSVLGAFVEAPATFYLVGRATSALVGTLTVGATYLLGARVLGRAGGLLAAGLLAVSLQHVVDSHFATTDVAVTALVVAAVLAALRYLQAGRPSLALGAGVLGGLAASAKYNGALAGAAFLGAYALRRWAAPGERRPGWRPLAAWGGGALAGFLAGTPYAALAPGEFLRGVLGEVGAIGTVQFGNEGDPPALAFHLLHALPQAVGWSALLAAGVGVVALLRRVPAAGLVVLAFPLPYLAVIASWESRFERYATPLLPFVAVLAATAALELRRWCWGRRPWVLLLAALALLAEPAARLTAYQALLRRPDTRELAGAWIERHLPPGSRLATQSYSPVVPLGENDLGARPALAPPAGLAPRLPRPTPRAAPRVTVVRLRVYDLEHLRARGIQYVALSSFVYRRHLAACDRFPGACRFYADLERAATLVFALEPLPDGGRLWVGDIYAPVSQVFRRTHPGPTIRIYRLKVPA